MRYTVSCEERAEVIRALEQVANDAAEMAAAIRAGHGDDEIHRMRIMWARVRAGRPDVWIDWEHTRFVSNYPGTGWTDWTTAGYLKKYFEDEDVVVAREVSGSDLPIGAQEERLLSNVQSHALYVMLDTSAAERNRTKRDRGIVAAYHGGHQLDAIARAAGMSESGVRGVLREAGVHIPRKPREERT